MAMSPEERKERQKEYYLKNKVKIKEKRKIWLQNNKDRLREWDRDYYQNNKEQCRHKCIEYRAKTLNREFELSLPEFITIVKNDCIYCGKEYGELSSLDRIDNNLGYTVNNCVPSCMTCNNRKFTKTLLDWIQTYI